MKSLIGILIYILIGLTACHCPKKTASAQSQKDNMPVESNTIETEDGPIAMAIFFSSMASGPADDSFLKDWVKQYIKMNPLTFTSEKYAGCGKEGEYAVYLKFDKPNAERIAEFKTRMQLIIEEQVKKNKAINPSSGPINIESDVKPDRFLHCRLGAQKWL